MVLSINTKQTQCHYKLPRGASFYIAPFRRPNLLFSSSLISVVGNLSMSCFIAYVHSCADGKLASVLLPDATSCACSHRPTFPNFPRLLRNTFLPPHRIYRYRVIYLDHLRLRTASRSIHPSRRVRLLDVKCDFEFSH